MREAEDVLTLLLKTRLAMERFDDAQTQRFLAEAEALAPDCADVQFLKFQWLEGQAERHGSDQSWAAVRDLLKSALIAFPADYRFAKEVGVLLVREPAFARESAFFPAETYLLLTLELIDPNDPELRHDRAEVLFCLGQTRMAGKRFFDAAQAYEQVCQLIPEMPWAWYHAAQAFELSWQLRTALKHYHAFQSQLRFIPLQTRRSLSLSVNLLQTILDPSQDNVDDLWQVLRSFSNTTSRFEGAVEQLCQVGRFSAALRLLERGTERDEVSTQMMLRRFQCHMALTEYTKGLEDLVSFLPRAEDDAIRRRIIEFALEAALMAGTREPLASIIESSEAWIEETPRAALLSGAWYVVEFNDLSRWQRAMARFGQDPLMIRYRQWADEWGVRETTDLLIARLFLANRDYSNAVKSYRRIGSKIEQDAALRLEWADVLALSGRAQEAFACYEALLKDRPQQADIWNNYGYFLARENVDLDRARELIEKSLELEPECGACLDSLGWVLFKTNHLHSAETYLNKALEQSPQDVEKLEHLGDVLSAMGRHREARRAYSRALDVGDASAEQFDRILEKLDPP